MAHDKSGRITFDPTVLDETTILYLIDYLGTFLDDADPVTTSCQLIAWDIAASQNEGSEDITAEAEAIYPQCTQCANHWREFASVRNEHLRAEGILL